MTDPLRLAELVCARFSHDLSGLLGSLSGVLDLIAEAHPGTEETAVAVQAADELTLRLRLLRAAWGGGTEPLDPQGLRTLARGLSGAHRIRLDLADLPEGTVLAPPMARMALNLLLLGSESMPRGGLLRLAGDPARRLVAHIAGPGAAWPPVLPACLSDEAAAWAALTGPRALQAPLTVLVARAERLRLSLQPIPDMDGATPLLTVEPEAG